MHEYRKKSVLGMLVVMLPLWMSIAMAVGPGDLPEVVAPEGQPQGNSPDTQPAQVGELAGEGPFAQFIVKYRAGSDAMGDQVAARARIADTVQRSASTPDVGAVEATWLRRLGVGADVFRLSQPLGRAEAQRLMQAFAADPHVNYIEADSVMTIQKPTMGFR